MEKEIATHSSVLAWRIPGMGEPGGLPSMGSHRVGHNLSDLAAAAAAEHFYTFLKETDILYYDTCIWGVSLENHPKSDFLAPPCHLGNI